MLNLPVYFTFNLLNELINFGVKSFLFSTRDEHFIKRQVNLKKRYISGGDESSSNSSPDGFKNKNIGKVNTPEQDTVKQKKFSSDPKTILKAYKNIISKNFKTEHGSPNQRLRDNDPFFAVKDIKFWPETLFRAQDEDK